MEIAGSQTGRRLISWAQRRMMYMKTKSKLYDFKKDVTKYGLESRFQKQQDSRKEACNRRFYVLFTILNRVGLIDGNRLVT